MRCKYTGCSELTSVDIPNSVTKVEDGAFSQCSGLTSVIIPESVTYLGNSVFTGCSNLTSVNIPESVTYLGHGVFTGCSNLTSVNIPKNITKIGDSFFYDCSSLTSIDIHNSITSIGYSAFWGCKGLTSISIPNSVMNIEAYAFSGCSGLTSVTIPQNVTNIGERTFENCSSLTSIDIHNSITSIGHSAFWGCKGLTSISIPNSVMNIEAYAFGYCSGLTSIVSLIKNPFVVSNVFYGINSDATLYVPQGTRSKYESYSSWNTIKNIIESGEPTHISIDKTEGLVTYCPPVGIDFGSSTDIAAYKATVMDNEVKLTKVNKVAAGEGVLLRSLNGGKVDNAELTIDIYAKKNEGNAFIGTLVDKTLATTDGDYTYFVLNEKDGVIGFYKANNTKVAAGKAYLPVENYDAVTILKIAFDDTTGISEISTEQAVEDDAIYTLGGVRVKNPTKGIYIMNGKKVIIK